MRPRLAAIVGVDLAAIVLLHHLRGGLPGGLSGLAVASPEMALATAARLVALVLGYWVAASLGLSLIASLTRFPSLLRAALVVAPPPLRRVVEGAAGLSLALAALAPPSALASARPTPTPVWQQDTPPPPYVPTPGGPSSRQPPPDEAPEPVEHSDETSLHLVKAGDNLWSISCRVIAQASGVTKPTSAQIVPYWRQVIELNRDRLRSGDPDLIYPDEEILLPPFGGGSSGD